MTCHAKGDKNNLEENCNYKAEVEAGFDTFENKKLPEVPLVTGEENDELITKFRAKIYRWYDKQWKESGAGDLKILRNKQNEKIRILMRQNRTGKLLANHYILAQNGHCTLYPHQITEKAWLWTCYDFSDQEAKTERLCVRFSTNEEYLRFQTEFEKAAEENGKLETSACAKEKKK